MLTIDTLWFDVAVVMTIFAVGNILFGHFEEHRPKWKRLFKMVVILGIVVVLSATMGRAWSLGFLLLLFLVPTYIHLYWLPEHGVNGWTGEPKSRYYELIGHRED